MFIVAQVTGQQIFDLDVSHFQEMFDGIVSHDVLGVEEVGDGRVRDAQLPVGLCQAPLRAWEENLTLAPEYFKS